MQMSVKPLPDAEGKYITVFHDITEQKKEVKDLSEMVYTDTLTRAPNRRKFIEILEKNLHAYKKSKTPFVLLVIDIHDLMRINEFFGRNTGDMVLKAFVESMMNDLEEHVFFGRIDGDRFAVLLENYPLNRARKYAKSVISHLHSIHYSETEHVKGNIAIISCHKEDDAKTMMERAERLIKEIKKKGGDRFLDDTRLLEEEKRMKEAQAKFLQICHAFADHGKALDIVNFYMEVPIQSKGEILKIDDESLWVRIRKVAAHALYRHGEIFVRMPNKPNFKGKVIEIDKEKEMVQIGDIGPVETSPLDRKSVEVRLEPSIEGMLRKENLQIPVEIETISLHSISITTPHHYTLKSEDTVIIEIVLRWENREESISLEGIILRMEKNKVRNYISVITFNPSKTEEEILTSFIAYRQLEIIKKLKDSML